MPSSDSKLQNDTALIPDLDPWLSVLCSADDLHPLLKNGVVEMDAILKKAFADRQEAPWDEISKAIHEKLDLCGYSAMLGGREYASSFVEYHTKTAQLFDWDYRSDIDEMITGMGYPATRKTLDTVYDSLAAGEGPPIHELSKTMKYEQAKNIARTVMLNIYVKASLKRWEEDGISRVKRLEMRDKKTCPICRALNGKEYDIADIIGLVFPLTNDSHPSCRGTFVPLISLATYTPQKRDIPLATDFTAGNNVARNVPIEVRPWLRSFLKSFEGPIEVDFDPTISESYTWDNFSITINPDALIDEDPREIILHAVSDQIWPFYEKEFIDEYIPLIKSGLARPSKSFVSMKELFQNNYKSYRMNQDEDPFSVSWWKDSVG